MSIGGQAEGRSARIDQRILRKIRPGETVWDTEVRGFAVQLDRAAADSGRKLYFLKTRLGGPTRLISIGEDGDPWTPESARREAWRLKSELMTTPVRARPRITSGVVGTLKPSQIVWDSEVAGFGVRCQRRAKVYFLKARIGGRQRWFTIGHHGQPWGPETARQEALKLTRQIAEGGNPLATLPTEGGDLTVTQLAALYLDQRHNGEGDAQDEAGRTQIEGAIVPLLGRRRIRKLVRRDVERFRDALNVRAEGNGANGAAAAGGAAAALAMLQAIFAFAVERGLRGDNPVDGIDGAATTGPRGGASAVSASDLLRLSQGLGEAEAAGAFPPVVAAIRLLALTGCEVDELLGLTWSQVDLEEACLRLPAEDKGERLIPLGDPAIQVLKSLPRDEDTPYVLAPCNGATPGA